MRIDRLFATRASAAALLIGLRRRRRLFVEGIQ
jgi:hypothetical protein